LTILSFQQGESKLNILTGMADRMFLTHLRKHGGTTSPDPCYKNQALALRDPPEAQDRLHNKRPHHF